MKLPISVIIPAYNEEKALPEVIKTVQGADEILVIDHQSTDQTAKVAKELGANVITRDYLCETVTQEDVDTFSARFGFTPLFVAGNGAFKSGQDKNLAYTQARNEWCFQIDADERVTWDTEKLVRLLPQYDLISCMFNHTHNPDGSVAQWFHAVKLSRRGKTWWQGRIHEAIIGYDIRQTFTDTIVIDHYQKPKEYRRTYLAVLEFSYLKDMDSRTCYYLAREYHNSGEWEKALKFFRIYLLTAFNPAEISKVYTLMASCLWLLKRSEEAQIHCFQAIKFNPKSREPLLLMSEFFEPERSETWREFGMKVGEEKSFI